MSKGWIKKFGNAWQGIMITFKEEAHMRVHTIVSILVISTSFYFDIDRIEWLVIIGAIALVLGAELINTAIENIVDLVQPDWNKQAGKIKDISAGAVFIVSIGAALIGIIIFWPHICPLFL